MLRFKYSPSANALYISVGQGEVVETIEIEESVYVDLDPSGQPVGIEFLDPGNLVPFLERHGGLFEVPGEPGVVAAGT